MSLCWLAVAALALPKGPLPRGFEEDLPGVPTNVLHLYEGVGAQDQVRLWCEKRFFRLLFRFVFHVCLFDATYRWGQGSVHDEGVVLFTCSDWRILDYTFGARTDSMVTEWF